MIKLIKRILVVLFVFVVCIFFVKYQLLLKVDETKLEALDTYKDANKLLLANIERIEKFDRSVDYRANYYKYGNPPFKILSANKYYFKNTILEEFDSDLSKIEELWSQNYLEGDYHNIRIFSDSTVIFKVKQVEAIGLLISHYLIFGENKNLNSSLNESNFARKRIIDKNCFYAIDYRLKF